MERALQQTIACNNDCPSGAPLTFIRLGGVYCPQPHCSPLPGLARDENVACQQGDAPQLVQACNAVRKPVRCLTSHAASILKMQIRQFWDNRGQEEAAVQKVVKHLEALLFRKKKYSVSPELWIPGGCQPGEEQHVEAVVSNNSVLQQIKEVLVLRETWLRLRNLSMNCQIRDKLERNEFLAWAKNKFHAEEYQQKLQQEDFKEGGTAKVKESKHSRWSRELERRLGTAALWRMVRVRRWLPEPTIVHFRACGSRGKRYNGLLSFLTDDREMFLGGGPMWPRMGRAGRW